jgi:very-short-patch-repair endonuclease
LVAPQQQIGPIPHTGPQVAHAEQAMAFRPDAKRDAAAPRRAPSTHQHVQRAYVAKEVSISELCHFVHARGGGDRAVAWVAGQQLGVITSRQLTAAGLGRGAIASRRSRGALHPKFRGVYLVGHDTPLPGAIEFAAVLACSSPAFVSHRSAAALWGLITAESPIVELTVPGRNCRNRDGLIVHRMHALDVADRAHVCGIPITSPARTLVDYAGTATATELERAIAEAFALRRTSERLILAAIERAGHPPGVAAVRAILGQPGGPRRTRSGGERAMLDLIRAAGLPAPRTDVVIAGFTADFVWPEERLIVEVDGYPFHGHRAAFERDHRRDIVHKNAGYEVLRFTGRQLDEEPLLVVAAIARALDRLSRG